jgi:hypothetical protein
LTPPGDLILSGDVKLYDDQQTFISGKAHTFFTISVVITESSTWACACILLNTGELGWLLIDNNDDSFFKTYAKKVTR